MKLVFLGPPGSGKGTQAKILSEKINIPHISTGDIFRHNISYQTELGKKAKEFTSKGFLVPDDITNEMVKEELAEKVCSKGFILDGYPRTVPQAKFLDSIHKIDKVINFELSDDLILKRIFGRRTCKKCDRIHNIFFLKPKIMNRCDNCGSELAKRDDESPEIVKQRIEVYKKQTEPLVSYYKEKKILVNIDASRSIDEIEKEVEESL